MGTRSTITFISEYGQKEPILRVYTQFDGYIQGAGHDLAEFLKDKTIINGIQSGQTMETGHANGMGCLSAQFVKHYKDKIGGVYLIPTSGVGNESYNYIVSFIDGKIQIEVDSVPAFKGSPEELLSFEESGE